MGLNEEEQARYNEIISKYRKRSGEIKKACSEENYKKLCIEARALFSKYPDCLVRKYEDMIITRRKQELEEAEEAEKEYQEYLAEYENEDNEYDAEFDDIGIFMFALFRSDMRDFPLDEIEERYFVLAGNSKNLTDNIVVSEERIARLWEVTATTIRNYVEKGIISAKTTDKAKCNPNGERRYYNLSKCSEAIEAYKAQCRQKKSEARKGDNQPAKDRATGKFTKSK